VFGWTTALSGGVTKTKLGLCAIGTALALLVGKSASFSSAAE